MAVIDAEGLSKRYGSVVAVDGVSLTVDKGEIFGLLGPNGAGKTTTLEMLEGLTRPDAGRAEVLGADVVREARQVKQRIGVQLQSTALPPLIRVREALELFAALYTSPRPVDGLLREFDLESKARARATALSGGQMQRLSIALALVNDPEVIFLDEPTSGLDPQARLNIWEVIEGVCAQGTTVMLTTHYMEEAERLCGRIAILDHGRVVALDTPRRLIAEHAAGTTIDFAAPDGVDVERLAGIEGIEGVLVDERVSVRTMHPERVLRHLLDPRAAWIAHLPGEPAIRDLRVRQGSLEDVFIALTGRTLRS